MVHDQLIFPLDGKTKKLSSFKTAWTGDYKDKKEAGKDLQKGIKKLITLQEKLFAHDRYSLLLIFQAMDAAGKDSTIKHVMSGVNPQGCQVKSFKVPSSEEIDHDFLWRCNKALPERGNIGIFNRSYYEEVLIVRVHQQILQAQKLPALPANPDKSSFWPDRYDDIKNFEKHLVRNGTVVLKFFLNVSKEEQKSRFLDRANDPAKNWKFSATDVNERQSWPAYMAAYEELLRNTSTEHAPWYVIPADKKWFMRIAVCDIINAKLESLGLKYPVPTAEMKKELLEAKKKLMAEK